MSQIQSPFPSSLSSPSFTSTGLSIPALEQVYDQLAFALDEVGEANTALFLVKLVLLNAQALGDAKVVEAHIRTAMQDLK